MGLDVYPTRVLKIVDFGDANCPPSSLDLSQEAVRAKVTEALQTGAIPIVLGGAYFITLPSTTAVTQQYGFGEMSMINFDAHQDTADTN